MVARKFAGLAASPELAACRTIYSSEAKIVIGEQIDVPTLLRTLRAQAVAASACPTEPGASVRLLLVVRRGIQHRRARASEITGALTGSAVSPTLAIQTHPLFPISPEVIMSRTTTVISAFVLFCTAIAGTAYAQQPPDVVTSDGSQNTAM